MLPSRSTDRVVVLQVDLFPQFVLLLVQRRRDVLPLRVRLQDLHLVFVFLLRPLLVLDAHQVLLPEPHIFPQHFN